MPVVYVSEMMTGNSRLYKGPLKENAIRVWAQDLLKGAYETTIGEYDADPNHHNILPILNEELEPTLERAGVKILLDKSEIDDLLSF